MFVLFMLISHNFNNNYCACILFHIIGFCHELLAGQGSPSWETKYGLCNIWENIPTINSIWHSRSTNQWSCSCRYIYQGGWFLVLLRGNYVFSSWSHFMQHFVALVLNKVTLTLFRFAHSFKVPQFIRLRSSEFLLLWNKVHGLDTTTDKV